MNAIIENIEGDGHNDWVTVRVYVEKKDSEKLALCSKKLKEIKNEAIKKIIREFTE